MMKTPSKLLALVLLVLLGAGCAQADRSSPPHGDSAPAAGVVGVNVPASERARIVTMDVAITVDRFDDALAQLRASVDQAGGYVSDMHANGTKDEETARLEIRVPADRAQAIRATFEKLGEVTSANEKVEDVTEQRADLEARLSNARTQEKRLLEIMATKSGSIADLVESEKELSRVRENVERLEAQQRSLKGKIDLATIHVSLSARSTPAWKTPGKSLYSAGRIGANGAAALAVYSGMALLTVAPSLFPVALVVTLLVLVLRRRRAAQLAALAG